MNHLESLDGKERRIPTVVAWRAVRQEIQAAFESVRRPLPPAPHQLDLVLGFRAGAGGWSPRPTTQPWRVCVCVC